MRYRNLRWAVLWNKHHTKASALPRKSEHTTLLKINLIDHSQILPGLACLYFSQIAASSISIWFTHNNPHHLIWGTSETGLTSLLLPANTGKKHLCLWKNPLHSRCITGSYNKMIYFIALFTNPSCSGTHGWHFKNGFLSKPGHFF